MMVYTINWFPVHQQNTGGSMKPVVIGVIFRRVAGKVRILTQMRLVQNKKYDPLYDQTWEAMGETVNEGESVIDALIRGVREECGAPDFSPLRIIGADGKTVWTTGKGDTILCCEPFCFVQQIGPPQPWLGPVFLVEVAEDFEPDRSKNDGEAGEPKWWSPKELFEAISVGPQNFMGLHMPALAKLSEATCGKF